MKRALLATLPALLMASQANALVGVAVSGGLNSTSISSADQNISGGALPAAFAGTGNSLVLHRGSMGNLTQLGVKAWLELPFLPIDLEVAENLGFGSYKSSLIYNHGGTSEAIPLDVKSPFAGLGDESGSTPYFSSLTDLTLRYPLLKFPPLSPIQPLKIWIGGGATYAVASRVVDQKDLQDVFADGSYTTPDAAKSTFKDKLTTNTMGGHLAAGIQLKIPVLPIALFIDGKWYLHVGTSDAASKYPFAANAGLGLAI